MILYIDPGTGSMLLTVIIGVITTGYFFLRKLILKLKFRIGGGKAAIKTNQKIPVVIFSDSKRYWNTFHPICDELERRGVQTEYWTVSQDDPALGETYTHVKCSFIGEGNRAFARLNMMNASVCLATTPGLDVYQWKRSPDTDYYVHILHETGGTLLYHMFGMDYYDAVLLTGEFQIDEIRELESVRKDPEKELRVVGCPYMDEMKKRLDQAVLDKHEGRIILLAPSWGKSGLLSLYGSKLIDSILATGYRLIIRPHPQSVTSEKDLLDKLMKAYPDGKTVEWNFDNDNFDVLNRADLMITDFSGVIFDYTFIFGKPIIYAEYEFDPAPYDAAWIKHPLWRDEIIPQLGNPLKEEQFGDLKKIIDETIESSYFEEGRNKAREEAWQNIGQSAKLTVDFLLEKNRAI